MTPPSEEPEDDILTPKAPSIAFPLANPAVAPQPQVRGTFLPCRCKSSCSVKLFYQMLFGLFQEEKKEEKPRFQLSSLSPQERIDYSHLIEELGESPT